MDFGDVIKAMKENPTLTFRRRGWNGRGIYIGYHIPIFAGWLPFIYIETGCLHSDNPDAIKGRAPWLASQTDMLADDWEMME